MSALEPKKNDRPNDPSVRGVVFRYVAAVRAGLQDEDAMKRLASWSVVVFAGIAAVGIVAVLFVTGRDTWMTATVGKQKPAPAPTAPVATMRNEVDGTPTSGAAVDVFAVMIDNMADARPQSGIAKARLVIEAPVEGGITRLMAVFTSDQDVKKIGPIRSARPYFLDWASEFDAAYAHVGGSPEALGDLQQDALRNVDEFNYGAFFWRDNTRVAPHNAYSSIDFLQLAAKKELAKRSADLSARTAGEPWIYSDQAPTAGDPATKIAIDYSDSDYRAAWRYDDATIQYVRIMAGRDEKDADGDVVTAKNVAIVTTDARVLDEKLRLSVRTTGSGRAIVFEGGRKIFATWKKPASGKRLRFFGTDGKELSFMPGTTWIEIVPTDIQINAS